MASFNAGICPKCNEHLLLKQGLVFLVCPLCAGNIVAREAMETLEGVYSNPAKLTENIAGVVRLEKKYGPEMPYQILLVLKKHFPQNEEIAFLALKMSGYNSFALKEYLTNFAKYQKSVAYAAEVISNGLVPKNWELSGLFEQYINNKTSGALKTRLLENLREFNAVITASPPKDAANYLIYFYYIICTLSNAALAAMFIILDIEFMLAIIIAVALLCVQMIILYYYAKKYGNRLLISETERALMVIFMCSLVIAVGGVFLGALT